MTGKTDEMSIAFEKFKSKQKKKCFHGVLFIQKHSKISINNPIKYGIDLVI